MSKHFKDRGVEVELDPFPPTKDTTHATYFHEWLRHNIHQFAKHHDEPHHEGLAEIEKQESELSAGPAGS
jgi:hypothetical protein